MTSKFSIIVPIFYGEKYISSIISQLEMGRSYLKEDDYIEIIFVNDSPDIPIPVKWAGKDIDITVINTDVHLGIHGARIRGLMEAKGEYILFLDQDDVIKPEYFHSQIQTIGDNDAVVCKVIHENKLFYSDNEMFKKMITKKFLFEDWNPIVSPGQVLLRRKSIPDEWIKNVVHYNGADDLFLWICMMAKGYSFALNYNVLYEHVMQKDNASNDIVKMRKSEQEVMNILHKEKILLDSDFNVLLNGFFKKNIASIYKLESLETKLSILEKLIELKVKNVLYSDYLKDIGIQTLAIYGCGIIGKYLYNETKQDINIKCYIDKNAKNLQEEIPAYTLQDKIPDVDGVVITLIQNYENLEIELKNKFLGKILILKEWLLT